MLDIGVDRVTLYWRIDVIKTSTEGGNMGVIRKAASIGTVGLVSFRSKKEKLHRAEADRDAAASDLAVEHKARELAEERVLAAEKKALRAETLAAKVAAGAGRGRPQSPKAKGPRRKIRLLRRRSATKIEKAGAAASSAVESVADRVGALVD